MKRNCFQRAFVLLVASIVLFGAYCIWHSSGVSNRDVKKFNKIRAAQPDKLSFKNFKEERVLGSQIRNTVFKKLAIPEGEKERFVYIEAQHSTVQMSAKKAAKRLVETFYDVRGIIQESLFYAFDDGDEFYLEDGQYVPGKNTKVLGSPDEEQLIKRQRFRYFEARRAIYDFQAGTLLANDITFWVYEAPEHTLHMPPYTFAPAADGHAASMLFSIDVRKIGGQEQFCAEGFSMNIFNEQALW